MRDQDFINIFLQSHSLSAVLCPRFLSQLVVLLNNILLRSVGKLHLHKTINTCFISFELLSRSRVLDSNAIKKPFILHCETTERMTILG